MIRNVRTTAVTTCVVVVAVTMAAAAFAASGGASYGGSTGGVRHAVSYINRDAGMPSRNDSIPPTSSCASPTRHDLRQHLSPSRGVDNNVHNDACLLDRDGREVDGRATFESYGVGYISACPDPDDAGPKTATLSDRDDDGRADRCVQSGYQDKGLPGDRQFHARFNSRSLTGLQSIRWCYDRGALGCHDDTIQDHITIRWVR